jgi:hypothetical protein
MSKLELGSLPFGSARLPLACLIPGGAVDVRDTARSGSETPHVS